MNSQQNLSSQKAMITYSDGLETSQKNERTCIPTAYEAICQSLNCYERIPTDRKVKPYFDIEIKPPHCVDGHEYLDVWKEILEYAEKFLNRVFHGANYCFMNASSGDYKCCRTSEQKWIISLHVTISNYLVSIPMLKSMVIKMNDVILQELNDNKNRCEKISDYYDLKRNKDGKYTHEFFDVSVYNSNPKMRSVYANKTYNDKITKTTIIENRPLLVVQGTFEQSVISAFNDEDSIEIQDDIPDNKFKPISPSPTSVTNIDNMEPRLKVNNKWKDLLYNVVGNKGHSHMTWVKLTGWCKTHLNRETFLSFVDPSWYEESEKMWESVKDIGIPIYWLQKLAKDVNVTAYKQWLESNNYYKIDANDLDDAFKTASVISVTLKETLVLCKEVWFMLTNNCLWKQQKEPSFYIMSEIRKYIDASNHALTSVIAKTEGAEKEKLVEKSKLYLRAYKTTNSSGFMSMVTKYLRSLLSDDSFADKLDSNVGFLAFENGIVNMRTGEFRHGIEAYDMLTATIPFCYTHHDESKLAYVKSKLLEILNNNQDHLEYWLRLIGYTFIGDAEREKSLYFCIDKTIASKGDNGKTLFFDILNELLPNYVYKTNKTFLEDDNKKAHKQIMMMKGKRLVWMDEFEEKKTNAPRMKEIGDGKTIECEIMFGTSESIDIMFKLWVLTNHLPNIDAKEEGVYNRFKQISYGSHFDRTGSRSVSNPDKLQFIADTSLADTIKTQYHNEIFALIIQYAQKYYAQGSPKVPEQFLKDTQETKKKNDVFGQFFDEYVIVEEGARIPLKELAERAQVSDKVVKEGMEKRGYMYKKDLSKMGKDKFGKAYKGGFEGCKFIEEEIDSDCEIVD